VGLGAGTCEGCPSFSTSTAGSTALSACQCDPGYSGPDGGPCTQCEAGQYKAISGSAACEACPANSQSPTDATRDHCLCDAGYTGANSQPCVPCAANSYKYWIGHASAYAADAGKTACLLCPDRHQTHDIASQGIAECECVPGTFSDEDAGGYCRDCPHGSFREGLGNNVTCLPCPAASTTFETSAVSQDECIPQGGWYMLGSWADPGPPQFLQCAENTYREFAQAADTPCWPCLGVVAEGVRSDAGSEHANQCFCVAPAYYPEVAFPEPPRLCLCAPGYYRQAPSCAPCPVGSVCPGEGSGEDDTPVPCASGATTAATGSPPGACLCQPGHTLLGGVCVLCAPGFFKSSISDGICDACPTGSSAPEGSLSQPACECVAQFHGPAGGPCQACPASSESPAGSLLVSDCKCVAGFGRVDDACAECLADTYSTLLSSGFRECAACGPNAGSVAESVTATDCKCNAGYTGEDGGSCSTCLSGKFKPEMIPGAPSWFVTAAGNFDTVRQACIEGGGELATINSIEDNVIAAAVCPDIRCYIGLVRNGAGAPWSWLSGDAVVYLSWVVGQGISAESRSVITKSNGLWDDWGAGADVFRGVCRVMCRYCPPDSDSLEASTTQSACQCNTGYTGPNGGPCTACPEDSFKPAAGPALCTPCPGTSLSAAGSDAQTDCKCAPGYSGPDGGGCQQCATGTFKFFRGSEDCSTCPANSLSAAGSTINTACKCDPGYSGPDGGACGQCAANTFKREVGSATCTPCQDNSVSVVGSSVETSCLCKHGWTGPNGGTCVSCAVNQWKTGNGDGVCKNCPANSQSRAGNQWQTACRCNAGWSGLNGDLCSECAAGKYRSQDAWVAAEAVCSNCAANSLSPLRSTSATSCTCNAGHSGADGGTCTACPENTHKITPGSQECTPCDPSASSEPASTSVTACVCNAGYSGAAGTACSPCGAGTYKHLPGPDCLPCPGSSSSAGASVAITACQCNVGYSGEDGGACSACLADTFKNVSGPSACEACAEFAHSEAASTDRTDCTCQLGYKGLPGDACGFICPPGAAHGPLNRVCYACDTSTYKPDAGDHSCTRCPPFSHHALTNQTSIAACLCQIGYLWDAGSQLCDACADGTFSNRAGELRCFACVSNLAGNCDAAASDGTTCPGLCASPEGYQTTPSGANLEPCPANAYNDGSFLTCQLCPAGSSTPAVGSTRETVCVCHAGYFRRTAGQGACEPCDLHTFKTDPGDAVCTACPLHEETLLAGSAMAADCLCVAGYERTGSLCVECVGSEKLFTGDQMCLSCPANAHLAPGTGASTHAPSACRCDAGYSGDAANGGACVACASGSFKTLIGPATCTPCGAHASSPSASVTQAACGCAAPLWEDGPDGLPSEGFDCQSSCEAGSTKGTTECEPCEAETYKATVGPEACSPCPSPANASLPGTASAANCTCRPGEIGLAEADHRAVAVGAYTVTEEVLCGPACVESGVFQSLVFTGPGPVSVAMHHGSASISLFACELDCAAFAGSTIPLATADSAFHAELRVVSPAGTSQVLRRYTARNVEPASFAGVDLAEFAVSRRLATADHVFVDRPTRVRERCTPCPSGLVCQ